MRPLYMMRTLPLSRILSPPLELSNDTTAFDQHLIVHPSFQCNLPPSDFAVADVCSDACIPPSPFSVLEPIGFEQVGARGEVMFYCRFRSHNVEYWPWD